MTRKCKEPLDRALLMRARELRRPLTPAEQRLWARLRNSQIGFKFWRQVPLERFIADFLCFSARLIVEVDGDVHAEQVERDEERMAWLAARGFRVIRFGNDDIYHRMDAVLRAIVDACEQGTPDGAGSPAQLDENVTPVRKLPEADH